MDAEQHIVTINGNLPRTFLDRLLTAVESALVDEGVARIRVDPRKRDIVVMAQLSVPRPRESMDGVVRFGSGERVLYDGAAFVTPRYISGSVSLDPTGEIAPVDVEVFPTAAQILPGHRLRIAIQAFDVPHLLPTATDLPSSLTGLKIYAGDKYPSVLTIPGLD